MPSPFPGMDPYLEHPDVWPDVHAGLIVAIRDSLAPRLRPRYRVAIEKRTYLAEPEELVFVGRPDVTVVRERPTGGSPEPAVSVLPSVQPVMVTLPIPDIVREGYLEVRDVMTGEVVTVLELLSPGNKRPGRGRRVYEVKRQRILESQTHLVEVDLLRGGEPMRVVGQYPLTAYRILISRSDRRPRAEVYAFGVQESIPSFPLPLRVGEVEPVVDVQTLLQGLYDRAGYDLAVEYGWEPVPPLEEGDAVWADVLLREKGWR
ncbi:MAG: DUF4058 family protein [Candidatus Latescibacteria bacterium]|nr:DUF4058 family protein [Candidatus Latescibacterota bacterium]